MQSRHWKTWQWCACNAAHAFLHAFWSTLIGCSSYEVCRKF